MSYFQCFIKLNKKRKHLLCFCNFKIPSTTTAFLQLMKIKCHGSSSFFQCHLCTLTMNLSQAQYIITDVPLQGKVKTYWFQLDFTVLIPACAQGQIIRKLHII